MRLVWGPGIYDMTAWTASQIEEVDPFKFKKMLADDVEYSAWVQEKELDGKY